MAKALHGRSPVDLPAGAVLPVSVAAAALAPAVEPAAPPPPQDRAEAEGRRRVEGQLGLVAEASASRQRSSGSIPEPARPATASCRSAAVAIGGAAAGDALLPGLALLACEQLQDRLLFGEAGVGEPGEVEGVGICGEEALDICQGGQGRPGPAGDGR